ncbi:MAG: (2Fe-2S)-binding protein [Deltaproteobacteria bacterium]|nr:(2Fe-2S)-binding protein [Deltaproteobacteria bacterium]
MKRKSINITVNGEKHEIPVEPNRLLLNVLREDLGLTGTKYGCGIGQCGGCTVLVDGRETLSCLTLARAVDGCEITTIEGVARSDGTLDPLQEAFLNHSAIQCGYCTPGMVMMGKVLLDRNSSPSEKDIREHIRGNICRCTGYNSIVRAIMSCTQASSPE